MLDPLVILYLFLGGAGAGALCVLCALELVDVMQLLKKRPSRIDNFLQEDVLECIFVRSWPLCAGFIAFSMLCLAIDLGHFDRILQIFIAPTPSVMALGAYALLGSLILSLVFTVKHLFKISLRDASSEKTLIYAMSVAGILFGLVTAIYTALLLQSMPSVIFWQNHMLVVVFLLSSASSGIAIVMMASAFVNSRESVTRITDPLMKADLVLILLEAAALIALIFVSESDSRSQASVYELLSGSLSWVFWGGVVTCGLIIAAALEWRVSHWFTPKVAIWAATLVLVGSLSLRCAIVEAGSFDITQAGSPFVEVASEVELDEGQNLFGQGILGTIETEA